MILWYLNHKPRGLIWAIFFTVRNTNLSVNPIPSGANLKADIYLEPGRYVASSQSLVSSLTNCPLSIPFWMDVRKMDDGYAKQCFTAYDGTVGISRTKLLDGSGTWLSDSKMITNADLKVTLKNNARLEIYSDVDTSYIDSFSGNTRRHRLVWSDSELTLYRYSGTTPTKIWGSS